MRTLRSFGAVGVLALLISIGARANCTAPATIKELQQCWQDNWNNKKLDSVMQLYADNATLIRGDGTLINRPAIETYWKGLINNVQFSISVVAPTEKGDLGYDIGGYQENIALKDNKQDQQKGAYSVVAEKVGEKWLVVLQVFVVQKGPTVAPAVQMFSRNLIPTALSSCRNRCTD